MTKSRSNRKTKAEVASSIVHGKLSLLRKKLKLKQKSPPEVENEDAEDDNMNTAATNVSTLHLGFFTHSPDGTRFHEKHGGLHGNLSSTWWTCKSTA